MARAGQNVILGFHADAATCNYSRYVNETWQHPDPVNARAEFFAALFRLLSERDDIKSIFPVGENDIRLLAEKYEEISSHVPLLMCEPELLSMCLDKPTMSATVDQLGIPQARHMTVTDRQSLFAAADTIGYPCIVKLADSQFLLYRKKALIYKDSDAIHRDFPEWPVENKALVVQTYVAGDRLNLYFFAKHGQITSVGQVLALRTDTIDGTGLSVSGRTVSPSSLLVQYCQSIVQHLNYTGVGCMQFLVDDENGITTFLEHNPRLGAGCLLPYVAGLDLPRIMLEFALGKRTASDEPFYPCKIGVQNAWTTGDLIGLKRALISREVGVRGALWWLLALLKTALTSPHHLTWDWRDPVPTFVQLGRFCRSAAKYLTSRVFN